MTNIQAKPWYQSGTLTSSLFTMIVSGLVAVTPTIASIIQRHNPNNIYVKQDVQDAVEIITTIGGVLGLSGAAGAAASRLSQGNIYTPRGFPGPNQDELTNEGALTHLISHSDTNNDFQEDQEEILVQKARALADQIHGKPANVTWDEDLLMKDH